MTIIAESYVAPDHPALTGHFPGYPIVPGVLLLNEVLSAIERHFGPTDRMWSWPVVKFLSPLRPGEPFSIKVEPNAMREFAFVVTRGETMIASGKVQPQRRTGADIP